MSELETPTDADPGTPAEPVDPATAPTEPATAPTEPAAAPTAPAEPVASAEPPAPAAPIGRVRGVAVALLWAGAALLTVLSAFAGLYSVSLGSNGRRLGYAVDVAGRYTGAAATLVVHNGVHYTFVLSLCAIGFGLLVVGSVGRVLDLPTGPRLDLAITAGGFAVTGVLAGVLVALYLQTTKTMDVARAQIHSGGFVATSAVAAGPYLALAALACAVLALAVTLWRRVGVRG